MARIYKTRTWHDELPPSMEEMEFLARLLGERTPWQVAGRRGTKEGSGSLDPQPGQVHPAVR